MGTFDDYLQQQEDPLFSPIGGYQSGGMSMADDPYGLISSVTQPTEDYSTAMEQLYTPISAALPEPEGTFNTPTFSLDSASDPFSKLLNEQIKESSLISDSYSEKLAEISDRQSKLTNSAENDWSTLGAALVGGIGGLLAGGSAAEIAGGAAAVGTTHYNNLEAQEKQKQALLTQDANRLLTEQKIEQSRTGQLRNTQAQAAARLTALQMKGDAIGTPENAQKQEQKKELKAIGSEKPTNDAYAEGQYIQQRKPILENISETPNMKPLPGNGILGSAPPSTYMNKRKTGTPMSKMENGYTAYLDGLTRARTEAQKGSQMNINVYREAVQAMSRGAKDLAEIGQAVTDSEFSRYVAPLLPPNEKFDIFSPNFDLAAYLDQKANSRNLPDMFNVLEKGMAAQRAKFFLTQGRVISDYDYSQLTPTALSGLKVEDLNRQSTSGPTFMEIGGQWFPNNPIDAEGRAGAQAPTQTAGETPEQELARLEAKWGNKQ